MVQTESSREKKSGWTTRCIGALGGMEDAIDTAAHFHGEVYAGRAGLFYMLRSVMPY